MLLLKERTEHHINQCNKSIKELESKQWELLQEIQRLEVEKEKYKKDLKELSEGVA